MSRGAALASVASVQPLMPGPCSRMPSMTSTSSSVTSLSRRRASEERAAFIAALVRRHPLADSGTLK